MSDCDCSIEAKSRQQRRVLITLLAINAAMFVVEVLTGILAESTGLIADSLDMLADAVVYGIGLYAVGRATSAKILAAFISGYSQMALALIVALDICRRAIFGSEPEPAYMVLVGLIALAANVACLSLIAKHRDGGVHMRASWIFSKNDVIANVGVILGGGLVYLTGVRWPDLAIGVVITYIVFRGAMAIIEDARNEKLANSTARSKASDRFRRARYPGGE
jgi:cation diffusion facilitator family transporter